MKRPNTDWMKARSRQSDRGEFTMDQDAVAYAAEYIEWLEGLLEGLTPGGSEFHQNPALCADFVKLRLASKAPAAIKERLDKAEADAERFWAILCRASDALGGPTPERAPHVDKWIQKQNEQVRGELRSIKSAVSSLAFCAPELFNEKFQIANARIDQAHQRFSPLEDEGESKIDESDPVPF